MEMKTCAQPQAGVRAQADVSPDSRIDGKGDPGCYFRAGAKAELEGPVNLRIWPFLRARSYLVPRTRSRTIPMLFLRQRLDQIQRALLSPRLWPVPQGEALL